MCRLFALCANQPVSAAWHLVEAPNSLLRQSCQDQKCESHLDGWGLASFRGAGPQVEKAAGPAADDRRFADLATSTRAALILAHVRNASIGSISLANTHPFQLGTWVFAHNGTLTGWDQVEPRLLADTPGDLLAKRHGTTDSELAFLWLLGKLARAGIGLDSTHAKLDVLTQVVGEGVRTLATWCGKAAPPEPAKLNFVLTNGSSLVATRWLHTLVWTRWELPHGSRQVAVASEATDDGDWHPLAESTILSIDSQLNVHERTF